MSFDEYLLKNRPELFCGTEAERLKEDIESELRLKKYIQEWCRKLSQRIDLLEKRCEFLETKESHKGEGKGDEKE